MMLSRSQKLRQFSAVLRKNVLLQTRGRRGILGSSGWGALIVQIMLPATFFTLMCIPRYYIQPYQHPVFLKSQEYDIDTKWWAGVSPYEGPAYARGGDARLVFVPNTPEVQSLLTRVAMAVSCPSEPYKRVCSSSSIVTFACLFGVQQAPAGCQDSRTCMQTPDCYQAALNSHFRLMASEEEVLQQLQQEPDSVDAVVVFPQAAAAAAWPSNTSSHTADSMQSSNSSNSRRGSKMAHPHENTGVQLLLDYVIRMNSSAVPPTQLLLDMFDVSPGINPLPGNLLWEYRKYWFFLNLQLAIDRALLGSQQSDGSVPANLAIKIKPFPWPAKQEDLGAATAAAFFNLLLVYAFMAPSRAVVGSIVREKELRLREGMKILGLSESAYWWSWSLTHWLTLAASGLLCALVGQYPFRHSSLLLMLSFYWLFSAALISFSYFLSTLFTASRVAGTATQLIYALSMIPGFLLPFVRPYGGLSWYLASLSPTSAASLFAAALVNWERLAAGVQWRTLLLPVSQGSGYCVGSVMWLLMLDVLLYAGLTWYFDKVMPTTYGQTLPPWFILQPSYWKSCSNRVNSPSASRASTRKHRHSKSNVPHCDGPDDNEATIPLTSDSTEYPNPASHAGQPYVSAVGLRRVFHSSDGGSRVAVEGLSLQLCAGRIAALLGRNGAGKTTTIHMLTGMLLPSSGTAIIGGHDIITQMSAIRQSLGVCPQFDILWPDITVLEHLVIYSVIKGAPWTEAGREARQAAGEVGLSDKLSSLASELSGGQRRKLSVAIAFLGRPAVVFLDEPTSGMDPYSRRATWELIKSRRLSSVIVLTTHSMEEADLLCDDVHIMADGRLVASGTPLTLKSQYGVGYTLTVVLQKAALGLQKGLRRNAGSSTSIGSVMQGMHLSHSKPSLAAATEAGSGFDAGSAAAAVEPLLQEIRSHVPSAVLLSVAGAEVSVRLPQEASAAFPAALRSLDACSDALGVASYGVSVTTLEEVFLAVADQAVDLRRKPQHARSLSTSSNLSNASSRPLTSQAAAGVASAGAAGTGAGAQGCESGASGQAAADVNVGDDGMVVGAPLYWQQFRALFLKRVLCASRDRLAVITQLLVPILLVLLAMTVSTLQTSQHQQPPLEMSRRACLGGAPALLAAAPAVRQQVEFKGFMNGYPRSDVVDTQYTQLYRGSAGPPLNLTLEGQLLSQFYSGTPHYDSMYLQHMPPLDQLLTSLGDPVGMTLLINQSAVSGLPAALNQATTALLRVMVAAGGGKGHPNSGHSLLKLPHRANTWSSTYFTTSGNSLLSKRGYSSDATSSGVVESLVGAGPELFTGLGSAHTQRRLHSISIRNFSSSAATCDASGCPSVGGTHLPSCLPRIKVSSAPFPLLSGEGAERLRQDAGALMLVLCMTMAASVLSASFVVFLVREQENNSKHLQLVSGAPPTAFWLANYCWDIINFSLPAAGIVMLVWGYNQPQLAGTRLGAMTVLLWVFGGAGINLTYLCHFMFKDELKALQRLNTAYFLIGYLGFTTTWMLSLIARIMTKASLAAATDHVKALLRVISPHYCFAQGLYDITNTYESQGGLPIPGFQPEGPRNPFAYSVLGVAVVHLLVQALLFGLATVLLDVGLLQLLRPAGFWVVRVLGGVKQKRPRRRRGGRISAAAGEQPEPQSTTVKQQQPPQQQYLLGPTCDAVVDGEGGALAEAGEVGDAAVGSSMLPFATAEDADVVAERLAVQKPQGAMVVLDGISKTYAQGYGLPPVRAVRGLWLRIMPGECFGLLGVNGAGKTSTFKILTGEIAPDSGDAVIAGHSVLTELSAARCRLGYCPQFEALPAAMTGREVLHLYARLRGVQGRQRVRQVAQQLLEELGLSEYADIVCGTYSGGNRRKLNVAVALVGGPPLVLLDEPSTGMDPAARRFLWRVLQSHVLGARRTIVLSSHSMEEVDALTTRLAIMAAGAATCLGTPQLLKSKYGDGYTLELRLSTAAQASSRPQTAAGGSVDSAYSAQQHHAQQGDGTAVEAAVMATAVAEQHFLSLMPGSIVLEKEPGRLLLRLPISSTCTTHNIAGSHHHNDRPQQQQRQQQHQPQQQQLHQHQHQHQGIVTSLADVFEAVELARQQLGITEYSLSQSSLERVFLALAKVASNAVG